MLSTCNSSDLDNKDNHTELLDLIETVVGNGAFRHPDDMGTVLGRLQREINGNFIMSMYIFFDEKSPLKKTIYVRSSVKILYVTKPLKLSPTSI